MWSWWPRKAPALARNAALPRPTRGGFGGSKIDNKKLWLLGNGFWDRVSRVFKHGFSFILVRLRGDRPGIPAQLYWARVFGGWCDWLGTSLNVDLVHLFSRRRPFLFSGQHSMESTNGGGFGGEIRSSDRVVAGDGSLSMRVFSHPRYGGWASSACLWNLGFCSSGTARCGWMVFVPR
jgi:hypothetical protein